MNDDLVGNFMMDQITKVNVNIILIGLYNYVAGTHDTIIYANQCCNRQFPTFTK